MDALYVISIYLLVINLIGFCIMGIDKYKAKKRVFRIPEATLFLVALIGGSLGSILGMLTFHHKTRHWYFVFGMPAILILQLVIAFAVLQLPVQFKVL
ncbi:MAG: DUF1294 domain-containing protein [Lachnospiraceae bacterium]|nr:DUF1294 domain-containing protein [Lachnospiraceae bacterium]